MSEVLISAVNPIDRVRIGTVGVPIPGMEVRVADDGEVLMRGPSMMLGYLNQPRKTAETIDAQGWMHSADRRARQGRVPADHRPVSAKYTDEIEALYQ